MAGSRMKKTLLTMFAATALGVAVNHGAAAQTNTLCTNTTSYPGYSNPPDACLYGGGSSLAAVVYQYQFQGHFAVTDPTFAINYTSIGSGTGQKMFFQNKPTDDTNGVTPAGSDIYFAASDATLNLTQRTDWKSPPGATGVSDGQPVAGNLVQLPTFGTPIAVVYRSTAQQRGNGALQFTDDQLCAIFSGKTTLWSQLTGITTGTNHAPTGTIGVVYRADNSGTTFLLTQHLATVCNGTNSAITFTAVQGFATLFGGTPPANFHGIANSSGVQGLVATNTGYVGYLSPDYTLIAPLNTGKPGFPAVSQIKNTHDGSFYLPTSANAQNALANVTAPAAGDPNPQDYVPAVADPQTFYPIVGFTTMDVAQCYADATRGGDMLELLQDFYQQTYLAYMLIQNGFSPVPANLQAAVVNNLLSPTNQGDPGPYTSMQDPNVCASTNSGGVGLAGR
jgi:ABC-type phosphate transport system substrate-binding protein